MKIDDIDALTVKGFLDAAEGKRLYELAREASLRGPVLEIGGYCGRSTLYLGLGCRENHGILYSVDHHRGSEEQQPGQEYFDPDLFDEREGKVDTFRFFRRVVEQAGLGDTVVAIVAPSAAAVRMWSTPLAMLFIDGDTRTRPHSRITFPGRATLCPGASWPSTISSPMPAREARPRTTSTRSRLRRGSTRSCPW